MQRVIVEYEPIMEDLVPLRSGQVSLIRRALRVYLNSLQLSINLEKEKAKSKKEMRYALEMKEHADVQIKATQDLLDFLRTWKATKVEILSFIPPLSSKHRRTK